MSKKSHKALASATVMSLILTSTLTATVGAATGVERLSGSNRETTAQDVAKKVFEKAETVVIVNGYKSADALSATPLAKALNAPILSVNSVDEPTAELLATLSSLGAKKVVVVGGEGAVKKAFADKLAATYTVERIEGKDRYATNVNVAKKVKELKDSKEAFVVNGSDASYADALSVASIAASKGAPIVFTNGKTVSVDAKELVKGLDVTAIGGTGVVSADVLAAVDAKRVGGADRFETNLEVLKAYKDAIKLDNVFVAYGFDFADALVASAAAAKTDAPVVLSDKTSTKFTKGATDYIEANKAAVKKVYLVGGSGVIADSVKSTIDSIVNPVVSEFKVDEVKSENLKDFEVKFTQKVDKKTAEDKENYTLNNNKEVEKAVLSDDGMTVRLAVKDSLKNQEEYKLSIKNVRNEAKDKKIDVKDLKFKTLDAALPEIAKIEALGNKAVKVTFTEPVNKDEVSVDSFRIDDKYISGNIEADNSRTVIIKSYNKLSDGEHTLTVKGIKDFAGYTMITKDTKFNVVEDKTAPVIEDITATFEKVRVKFSEPVQNVRAGSNAYWTTTSGTKKNTSVSMEKIEDDIYEFTFDGDKKLPPYGVNFYLVGVKDYSDNEMDKDKPVIVTANIDEVRPEVTSVEVVKDGDDANKVIEVKFSKGIENLKDVKNYSLKDKDGKSISIYQVEPKATDNKTAKIKFYNKLKDGEYTLKLEGLRDNTTLQNTILPYEETITVKNTDAPKVASINVEQRRIILKYDKVMSVEGQSSIANTSNYLIEYNSVIEKLPEGTSIQVLDEGKSVLIILPDEINSKPYARIQLTKLFIQNVEDANGNILAADQRTKRINQDGTNDLDVFGVATDDKGADEAELKDSKTIEIEFNQPVGAGVSPSSFDVKLGDTEQKVSSTDVTGDTITLTLEKDLYTTEGLTFTIKEDGFKSAAGQNIVEDTVTVKDKVKPELKLADDQYELEINNTTKTIEVPFSENIKGDNIGLAFKVIRVEDKKELAYGEDADYTASIEDNKVKITINPKVLAKDTAFTVELVNTSLVKDIEGNNSAEAFDAHVSKVMTFVEQTKVTP